MSWTIQHECFCHVKSLYPLNTLLGNTIDCYKILLWSFICLFLFFLQSSFISRPVKPSWAYLRGSHFNIIKREALFTHIVITKNLQLLYSSMPVGIYRDRANEKWCPQYLLMRFTLHDQLWADSPTFKNTFHFSKLQDDLLSLKQQIPNQSLILLGECRNEESYPIQACINLESQN